MKKKSILIYSILISMVFSFAVIYFALALRVEYKQSNYRTDQLFYTLCEDVKNSENGLPSMDFIEKDGYFAAVTIFKNRKCIFSYPSENAQDIEDTKLIKINKKAIKNRNSTLEVTAAIYTLRPRSIFNYGKISFIVILIATLFTIGLIIYSSIKDDNEPEEADNENLQEETPCNTNTEAPSNEEEPENASNDEESDDEVKDENEKEESDNGKENAENSSEDIKTSDELKESEENNATNAEQDGQNECDEAEQNADSNSGEEYKSDEQNTDLNNDAITAEDSNEQAEQEITEVPSSQSDTTTEEESESEQSNTTMTEEDSTSNQNETSTIAPNMDSSEISTNEAQEIFSVSTGFCLQNQLQTRLDAELVRCGASELDLSLFIVKITNSEISEEIAKKIGECLLCKIQFRDCIFEYGKNSFAFIIPEIEIEQAEDFAEELYNDISKIIDNTDAECFIGISARTMRVISASRLINEAEEALDHATKDGKSKIIGFHVDIEKYRQFIKDETK